MNRLIVGSLILALGLSSLFNYCSTITTISLENKVHAKSAVIDSMLIVNRLQRDSLRVMEDSIRIEHTRSVNRTVKVVEAIEELTEIEIKDSDIKEALEWLEQQ